MANKAAFAALPWLPEEDELAWELFQVHGRDFETIRKLMLDDGWDRTAKAIAHRMKYRRPPRRMRIGINDPIAKLAICKKWTT